MGAHLMLALRAAEAGADLGVLPRHGGAAGEVPVEQPLQRLPAGQVDRQQFVGAVARDGAVAEHQFDLGRDGDPGPRQGVGVRGELQQRLDLDRAGELGVAEPVAVAVRTRLEHQEVGEAEEPAVEHGGLVDGGRAAIHRFAGGLGGGGQAGQGVGGPADDDDVLVLLGGAEFVEVPLFVLVAELRGAGEQFVVGRHVGAPAEAGVERAQQGVLAPRRGGEVGCAVDDAAVGPLRCHEHDCHCRSAVRHHRRCAETVVPVVKRASQRPWRRSRRKSGERRPGGRAG